MRSGNPHDRPGIDIIWDTFKAYLRGVMIGYVSKKKADFELGKARRDKTTPESTQDPNK